MTTTEAQACVLELRMHTDDPQTIQMCEAYWACTPDGKFAETIAALGARFCVPKARVSSIVGRSCTAFYKRCKCLICGTYTTAFTRRYDFEFAYSIVNSDYPTCYGDPDTYRYCASCRERMKREEADRLARERLEMMRDAFESGVYQSLEPLEFSFLVQLASSASIREAHKRVGLAYKDAAKLLAKFNDLSLIDWKNDRAREPYIYDSINMLDELRTVLRDETLQRRVKSIFGSPKAIEVFRKLKAQHAFVFPEIPVCAFVDKSDIEHLFEQGDFNYFLTCRVDFLICEPDGTPKGAVEYQGSYHTDAQQAKRDEFKRRILNAVGLPLTTITSAELKSEDALP